MNRLLSLFACLALIVAHGTAQATPISQLIVFGDSNSDPGNVSAITNGIRPPSATYWNGRYSNGPVAVEYMANTLGITAQNYAQGGAQTGTGNVTAVPSFAAPSIDLTKLVGVQTQVSNYLANNSADPNALYFIWAGTNDFYNTLPSQTGALIQAGVLNITNELNQLHAAGAEHFFVPGLYYNENIPGNRNAAFNMALEAALQNLSFDVTYFDTAQIFTSLINSGLQTTPCLQSTENPPFNFPGQLKKVNGVISVSGYTVCSNPDQHLIWDPQGHLTTTAQQVVGEAFAAAVTTVPEPATLALTGTGLALLMFLRRKSIA